MTTLSSTPTILTVAAHITRRVMEALPKCKVIVRYGIGFDTIDVDAATDNCIIVVNNPALKWCVEEVSDHAITLLLACAKKLAFLNDDTKQGRWAECKRVQAPIGSIHGQTLGLVGCGSTERMTGRKAQCFSLRGLQTTSKRRLLFSQVKAEWIRKRCLAKQQLVLPQGKKAIV